MMSNTSTSWETSLASLCSTRAPKKTPLQPASLSPYSPGMRLRLPATTILATFGAALCGCFAEPVTADIPEGTESTGASSTEDSTTGAMDTSATESDSASGTSMTSTGAATSDGTTTSSGSSSSTTEDPGSESSSTGTTETFCGFVDEFSGEPSSLWDYTQEEYVTTEDDELVMTVTGATMDTNRMLLPVGQGFLDRSVTVELGDVSTDNGMQQMIRLETPQGQGPDIVSFRVQGFGTGPRLQVWYAEDNIVANATEIDIAPFSSMLHRFLQMTESGGTLSFAVSADGVSFEEVHTFTPSWGLDQARVGVAAANYIEQAADVDVSFRSFAIDCE